MRKKWLQCVALLLTISCLSEPITGIATEPVKKNTTRAVTKIATEPVKKNTTRAVTKIATEPVKKNTTRAVIKIATEPVKKNTTKTVTKITTEPVKKNTTKTVTKITTEPVKKNTTETVTKPTTETTTKPLLSLEQRNSIEWLNYLAMISQEIDSSQNNRMYLEEVYNALMDNTDPANLNERTKERLSDLFDTIQAYRINDMKREQLEILYERQKARVLKESITNATEVFSVVDLKKLMDFKRTISVIVFMPVEAYSSYTQGKEELSDEYLKDGWTLDNEAMEKLHENRKSTFVYMLDLVKEYNLPSELTLSEETIRKFVECKNNTNVNRQIQFLESEKKTYQAFSNYWLLLSECYYKNQDYQKCLDAITEYQAIRTSIFRKDYYYARALSMGIGAAAEILPTQEYIETAENYLDLILCNTKMGEWEIYYFCAQVYIDLYHRTKNENYLQTAYDLLLNNINQLVDKQNALNNVYLADVAEIPVKDALTKEEKKQIKQHNKSLKKKRKTELPEIYEPLAVNCDMLFSLVNFLHLSDAQKKSVEGILYDGSQELFLTQQVKNWFSFHQDHQDVDGKFSAVFDGKTLQLPVFGLASGATITMTVKEGKDQIYYDDWEIEKVDRSSEDFYQFQAIYKSEKVKAKKKWSPGQIIQVEINNGDYVNSKPIELQFKVVNYKKGKFLLSDTYDFEQIT